MRCGPYFLSCRITPCQHSGDCAGPAPAPGVPGQNPQKLAKTDIVTTHRGVGGGISLARAPEQISLLDVIEAVEGPVLLNRCFVEPGVCPREDYCAIHLELEQIGKSLAQMFAKVNFARLARNEAALMNSSQDRRLKTENSGDN